jgi:hypothetical protein
MDVLGTMFLEFSNCPNFWRKKNLYSKHLKNVLFAVGV